ncbi:hypothetical protein [Streptomyces sp. V2I9]|uniref:NACHT N-terminal Helical domain 1-containing protein n=1 Tax=Streptomyces sp. V2I9 TaxID=3042304 RepID=UPI0035930590
MSGAYADLPEHERPAALASVEHTFAAVGEPNAGRLFALEPEPERLRAELSAPAAGLSERPLGLYETFSAAAAPICRTFSTSPSTTRSSWRAWPNCPSASGSPPSPCCPGPGTSTWRASPAGRA